MKYLTHIIIGILLFVISIFLSPFIIAFFGFGCLSLGCLTCKPSCSPYYYSAQTAATFIVFFIFVGTIVSMRKLVVKKK